MEAYHTFTAVVPGSGPTAQKVFHRKRQLPIGGLWLASNVLRALRDIAHIAPQDIPTQRLNANFFLIDI